jgi:hypothetical protein
MHVFLVVQKNTGALTQFLFQARFKFKSLQTNRFQVRPWAIVIWLFQEANRYHVNAGHG